MIKKYTALSFAFCALILSSTLSSTISSTAPDTQKAELLAPQTECCADTVSTARTQYKTTGQRIVAGLINSTVLVPSALITCLALFAGESEKNPAALFVRGAIATLCLSNITETAPAVYDAIKNCPSPDKPVSAARMAKLGTAGIGSIVTLSIVFYEKNMNYLDRCLFSIPAVYGIYKSIGASYSLLQNKYFPTPKSDISANQCTINYVS